VRHDLDQYIPGFANLTAMKHAPVFLGFPHMMLAEKYWLQKIKGMKTPSYVDLTTVDVEPWTGKVVSVSKGLQVNILVPPNSDKFMFFNPKFPVDIMYPIMWAIQVSTITPALADIMITQLYGTLSFIHLSLPVFVPVGSVLAIVGFLLAIVFGHLNCRLHKPTSGYVTINTDE